MNIFTNKKIRAYVLLFVLCVPLFFINIRDSHDWGDDFAQYIHQAINITKGIPQSETGYVYTKDAFGVDVQARPVGFPLMLAPVYVFFGNSIKAFSITITFILFLVCMCLLSLFRKYSDNLISVLLIMIFVYNPFTINFKMEIMSDIPFTLFLLLSVLAYSKMKGRPIKNYLLTGILIGFLISIRIIGITLLAAVIIDGLKNLWLNRNSKKAKIEIIKQASIIITSSLFIYMLLNVIIFPEPSGDLGAYFKVLTFHNLPEMMQRMFTYYLLEFQNFFLSGMGIFPSIAILTQAAVVVFAIVGFINKCLKKIDLIDIFVIVYLLSLFLYPDTHSGLRFLFPVIPFLIYYIVLGVMSVKINFALNRNAIVIVLGLFVLVHYSYFLIDIIRHQKETLAGPQERESIEAFAYIKNKTSSSAAIVFIKPKALSLYTGRKAFALKNRSTAVMDYRFKTMDVNYLLENVDLPDECLSAYITENKDKVNMIWSNSKFHLYEMNKTKSDMTGI